MLLSLLNKFHLSSKYQCTMQFTEDGFTKLTKIGHFEALSAVSKHCQIDPSYFSIETYHCILQLERFDFHF